MNNDLTGIFNNTALQKRITDTSCLGTAHLSFSLANLKALQMAIKHMRTYGPDEIILTLAEHHLKQVEKVELWLTQETEHLLDFVVDLRTMVCKLSTIIKKQLKEVSC